MSLERQDFAGELSVVVAVNDSSAETYAEACRLAESLRGRPRASVTVVRTAPGRAAALIEGDRMLPTGIRVYLDQDARLSGGALRRLADLLGPGGRVKFAVPRPAVAARSWLSRAFYTVWCALPYIRDGAASMGVYAVSDEGRRRWDTVPPDLGCDDKWVRRHFTPAERAVAAEETYEVLSPDGLRALVAARRRYLRTNRRLDREWPQLRTTDLPRHRGALRSLAFPPSRWPASAGFLLVYALAWTLELMDRGRRDPLR
jgi:hypothetical protein